MANILPTTALIAKETLAIIRNNKGFYKSVNRDYEKDFKSDKSSYDTGQTILLPKPPRFQYRAGRVATPQDVIKPTVPLTVSQGGTEYAFTSLERTLSVSRFEEICAAAADTVMNQVDAIGLEMVRRTVGQATGTIGTPPNTQASALNLILSANQRLDEQGASRVEGDRFACSSPLMNASITQGFAGMFNSQSDIAKQYRQGLWLDSMGLSTYMDPNVARHFNGTNSAANTVNGANQSGPNLVVSATNGTITAGTSFTIAGVFTVNPVSRIPTGTLYQFVVASDVASGATTIPLGTAVVLSGAFQNVSAAGANGAALTFLGGANVNYDCSVVYDRNAFTLAMLPMAEPFAGGRAKQLTEDGITIKVTEYYDGVNDNNLMRLDVLFGWAAPYPELACKIIA